MSAQKISNPQKTKSLLRKTSQINHRRWFWLGCGLTGVAMLSATAGALLAVSLSSTPLMQRKLSSEEAAVFAQGDWTSMNLRLPNLTRPVNILVLGMSVLTSDLKEYKTTPGEYFPEVNSFDGLSDVMLLLRFNPDTKTLNVLSIPRDTRAEVEGMGMTKINDANYHGGPAIAAKAVSQLLAGVPIDRYVRVNVGGVEKLVEALGGVTIYVPEDMKYRDDSQHLYINLKAGKQHLNGNQALQYLRFRYDDLGDIGRIQRQQVMMRTLIEQSLNPAILIRLPEILSVIQEHIDTNLSVEELMALVGFGVQTDRTHVKMLMVPGEFSDPKEYELSFWLPHKNEIETMVAQYFDVHPNLVNNTSTSELDNTYMKIAVQDSTNQPEAVDKLIDTLVKSGYSKVYVSRPWSEPLAVTRIVAQNGDIKEAEAVRRSLGFGEVRVESTGSLTSDVTVQLGKDWLKKKQQSVDPNKV